MNNFRREVGRRICVSKDVFCRIDGFFSIESRSLATDSKKQDGQRKDREKSFSAGKSVSEAFHKSSRRMHWMRRRRKGNPTKEERRQEPAKQPPRGLLFHNFNVHCWKFMSRNGKKRQSCFFLDGFYSGLRPFSFGQTGLALGVLRRLPVGFETRSGKRE